MMKSFSSSSYSVFQVNSSNQCVSHTFIFCKDKRSRVLTAKGLWSTCVEEILHLWNTIRHIEPVSIVAHQRTFVMCTWETLSLWRQGQPCYVMEFNSLLSINSRNSFSPNSPLRCCRSPPYRYEGGECRQFCNKVMCGNRLTLRLSTMAAGITPGSLYEVNDKEVPSYLNRDIDIWGHARRPGLLWSVTCVVSRDKLSLTPTAADTSPFHGRHEERPFASPPPPQQKSNLSKSTSKTNKKCGSQPYQCHEGTGGSPTHMLGQWWYGPLRLLQPFSCLGPELCLKLRT